MPSSTPAAELDYWHAEYTKRGMTMFDAATIAVLGAHALVKSVLGSTQLKCTWSAPDPKGTLYASL